MQFPKMVEKPLAMTVSNAEYREGSPMLTAVQAVPAPPKAVGPKPGEEPGPDVSKIKDDPGKAADKPAGKNQPAVVESPPEDKPEKAPAKQPPTKKEGRPATEPDDPDLIK
jgi:hypothetical protein